MTYPPSSGHCSPGKRKPGMAINHAMLEEKSEEVLILLFISSVYFCAYLRLTNRSNIAAQRQHAEILPILLHELRGESPGLKPVEMISLERGPAAFPLLNY